MARRLVVAMMVLPPLVLSACEDGRSSSAEGISSPSVEKTPGTPDSSATAAPSATSAGIAEQRDRLQRQLLGRNVDVKFLDDDAETLRGDSMIDGTSLDERLESLGFEFTLVPDDDVYTARVTTLGMGRPIGDGSSVDPKYQDVVVWVMRRHHVLEFTHGQIPQPGDPPHASCAFFSDYVYVFVPSPHPRQDWFAMNLPQESETGTEKAEAEAAGTALCQSVK